jgi:hypothetical protein
MSLRCVVLIAVQASLTIPVEQIDSCLPMLGFIVKGSGIPGKG